MPEEPLKIPAYCVLGADPYIPPAARAELPEGLESRIRAFIARFSSGGANYFEWDVIAQVVASPDLATDPTPIIDAYNRLFVL